MTNVIDLANHKKVSKHNQEIANLETVFFNLKSYLKSEPDLKNIYQDSLADKRETLEYLENMLIHAGHLYKKINNEIHESEKYGSVIS